MDAKGSPRRYDYPSAFNALSTTRPWPYTKAPPNTSVVQRALAWSCKRDKRSTSQAKRSPMTERLGKP